MTGYLTCQDTCNLTSLKLPLIQQLLFPLSKHPPEPLNIIHEYKKIIKNKK
ncbi:hypothetical protein Hanom_Chr13g01184671 [Helianthus anomalus]